MRILFTAAVLASLSIACGGSDPPAATPNAPGASTATPGPSGDPAAAASAGPTTTTTTTLGNGGDLSGAKLTTASSSRSSVVRMTSSAYESSRIVCVARTPPHGSNRASRSVQHQRPRAPEPPRSAGQHPVCARADQRERRHRLLARGLHGSPPPRAGAAVPGQSVLLRDPEEGLLQPRLAPDVVDHEAEAELARLN